MRKPSAYLIVLSMMTLSIGSHGSPVHAEPQRCLSNLLVQLGDISAEQAPTCFVSSQCIKESETRESIFKICFANFRYEPNGWLLFELGRTISSYQPYSSTNPPYITYKWDDDQIADREQTLALDCHGKKMWSYLHSSALPLAPWQSAICDYYLGADSLASPSLSQESSLASSSSPATDSTRSQQLLQPKPQLYETLSATPFYWKRF
jgi:hypothetical protein